MIGTNLHRFYDGQYIIRDGETECLTLRYNRPWQWVWAICDNKQIIETKTRYVYWSDLNISADAARITRFNRLEWSRQARPAKEVLDEFDADFYNPAYRNIGHGTLSFDDYIHDYWRELCGKPQDFSYQQRSIDTDALSRAYLKGMKPDLTNLLGWQYKMKTLIEKGLKSNLGDMCKSFKLPFDANKAHDGKYDVDRNHELFKALLYAVEF